MFKVIGTENEGQRKLLYKKEKVLAKGFATEQEAREWLEQDAQDHAWKYGWQEGLISLRYGIRIEEYAEDPPPRVEIDLKDWLE